MRACEACFAAKTWLSNASPPTSSPGKCDFGHGYSPHTWLTTVWADSFSKLCALYETTDDNSGVALHQQVQTDWRLFSFDEKDSILNFLSSALGGDHPLLQIGITVRLRIEAGDTGAKQLSSWSQFSQEIRTQNRYFPGTVPDRKILENMLYENITPVMKDVELFRARVISPGQPITPGELGAPPADKASPGRANPVGIPYLYLSFDSGTCIYETRVSNHSYVALGTFRAQRDLEVLNLADIEDPDFFDVNEIENVKEQTRRISFHRYLTALGDELKRPVRASDHLIDYIPTQYLCELAKSFGLDGVLYGSSLDPNPAGRNLVLFDVTAATCEHVEIVKITSLTAAWEVSQIGS